MWSQIKEFRLFKMCRTWKASISNGIIIESNKTFNRETKTRGQITQDL